MDNPNFFLEAVVKEKNELQDFEGPLSLILLLLQKNKIEIRDISVSDILDQYLEYLDKMQSLDLEVASEFVQMASHLLYIKTKMLLSGDEEVSELELLMSSLEQLRSKDIYASVEKLVPELRQASQLGLLYYSKQPEPLPRQTREYSYRHEPVDLLRAMYDIYSRGGRPEAPDMGGAVPTRFVFSIREKSAQILRRLEGGAIKLNALYAMCRSRSEIVATFMSVLELCSMGSLTISRGEDEYTVEFTGGNVEEIIEKIVE